MERESNQRTQNRFVPCTFLKPPFSFRPFSGTPHSITKSGEAQGRPGQHTHKDDKDKIPTQGLRTCSSPSTLPWLFPAQQLPEPSSQQLPRRLAEQGQPFAPVSQSRGWTSRSEAPLPPAPTPANKWYEAEILIQISAEAKSPALWASPSSSVAATRGSGTGPLCPTQIRRVDTSGEHLSVPACGTSLLCPVQGCGGETRQLGCPTTCQGIREQH